MEYKINEDKVVLGAEEFSQIINNLTSITNSVNEILKIFSSNNSLKDRNLDIELNDIDYEIKQLYTNKIITYKQYKVLKYILENRYVSDAEVSKSTSVSYSSIFKWKKENKKFKCVYDKILLIKTL